MAEITWLTAEGSLGKYVAYTEMALQLYAESSDLSSIVRFKLLSGSLPLGTKAHPVRITDNGEIVGILQDIPQQQLYSFTVRAFDQYGNIRDRTFNITVATASLPQFVTPPGVILNILDSTFINKPIQINNPAPNNIVEVRFTSGEMPPGLYITPDGIIRGYAKPPLTGAGSATTKTYEFTLQLFSPLGNASAVYSIVVNNQNLLQPPDTRPPAIVNSARLTPEILPNDPLYRYYLPFNPTIAEIPTIRANEYWTFKVIGHDFENDPLKYTFSSLPPGVTGNPLTGWISGVPQMPVTGITNFQFSVTVNKLNKPNIRSLTQKFAVTITNNLTEDIQWISPANLGYVYNGIISELKIEATSSKTLVYSLASGKLPPNLSLLPTGELVGKISYQPSTEFLLKDAETEFTFTVLAYAEAYPVLKSLQQFTLTVKQYFATPLENVYLKASPDLDGRKVLKSLLTDTNLIPTDYLYRPQDKNFGKATDISVLHTYGLESTTLTNYLAAIQKNHYKKKIILGDLKTAIGRDDDGNIIYEVVYSEVIDKLVNNSGQSIPMEIQWPTDINLRLNGYNINNSDIYASYSFDSTYNTSLSPGLEKNIYPASLQNMRNRLIENIDQTFDRILLPRWMTSQQENGNILGYVEAWVICYALPGKGSIIKDNIKNNWNNTLNVIDFTIDRYYVDKSNTYNYNTNISIPAWNELPGASPNPTPANKHDLVALFPKESIIPRPNS